MTISTEDRKVIREVFELMEKKDNPHAAGGHG